MTHTTKTCSMLHKFLTRTDRINLTTSNKVKKKDTIQAGQASYKVLNVIASDRSKFCEGEMYYECEVERRIE